MPFLAKFWYMILYILLNLATYFGIKLFITNDYNFLTSIDEQIPFIPDFVWIYHSLVPVLLFTYFFKFKTKQEFWTNFIALCAVTAITNFCYLMWPSFYPYPNFEPHTISEILTKITHWVDGASNTFPSGHAALSCLLFLGVVENSNTREKWIYGIWCLLICCSTLLLKQHYVVDIIAGLLLAVAIYYMTRKFMRNLNKIKDSN